MWTPIEAIFRGGRSSQTPVRPSSRVASSRPRPSVRIERLLEVAAVPLHVLAVPLQVEDRVADELARAVVVDLPPRSVSTISTSAPSGTCSSLSLGAAPERDHRRVLEQHHRVRDRALRDRAGERALQFPGLEVGDSAEVEEVGAALHVPSVPYACSAVAGSVVPRSTGARGVSTRAAGQ